MPSLAEMPGPDGGLRPLMAFNRDAIGCLARWHAEYGDTFGWKLFGDWFVSLRRAEDVAAVLLDRGRIFHKDPFTAELSRLLGDGLLTSEGDHWRGRRKLIAPTLRRGHIKHYADVFVRHARRWAAEVSTRGGEVDLHQQMMQLTLAIVAEALFAVDELQGVDRIEHVIEQAMAAHIAVERGLQRLVPGFVPYSGKWKIKRAADAATEEINRLIAARRERPAGSDLMWRLLEARDEDGTGLDAAGLRDEVVTLYLAGHETTALALTFAVHLLGTHPAAEQRLREELAQFGDRPLTADDMPALRWTTAIVEETLRLVPPAWLIGRTPIEDTEIGGWAVPAGTTLLIPIITIHQDPLRFAAPNRFRPERWLDGRPGRWDYLPFGGGARVCVGNHFALMEAALVLASMYQGARIELVRKARPALMPSITLRPLGGLPVRISPA